jgi:hypothetical protein
MRIGIRADALNRQKENGRSGCAPKRPRNLIQRDGENIIVLALFRKSRGAISTEMGEQWHTKSATQLRALQTISLADYSVSQHL